MKNENLKSIQISTESHQKLMDYCNNSKLKFTFKSTLENFIDFCVDNDIAVRQLIGDLTINVISKGDVK